MGNDDLALMRELLAAFGGEEIPEAGISPGEGTIVALYRASKAIVLYGLANPQVDQLLDEAILALARGRGSAPILVLQRVHDACLCNQSLIRVTAESYPCLRGFLHACACWGIDRVEMAAEVSREALGRFLALLASPPPAPNVAALMAALQTDGLTPIQVAGADEPPAPTEDPTGIKHQSREVYFSTLATLKASFAPATPAIDLRRAKRLMQVTVDLLGRDRSALLGLANIKRYDDYTFNHSVNVAIYAVALGQSIGLPRHALQGLGLAGLFHDLGKVRVTKTVLNKPGALLPEEWEEIRTHPLRGAELILELQRWSPLTAGVMEAAFEHHLRYNLTGYPAVRHLRRPSLFARIIALADCYDALGRPRVYRQTPYVSEKVLGMLLARSGRDFDPILVKAFINLLGIFPLGSLVLLDTQEIGVVTASPDDGLPLDRPHLCLLHFDGGATRRWEQVNLADRDPATGLYSRSILQTLDPNDYNFSIEEFFF
jgi:HD-GYP domain-containing protein (c-di-GMP phosphodiesterase class II)